MQLQKSQFQKEDFLKNLRFGDLKNLLILEENILSQEEIGKEIEILVLILNSCKQEINIFRKLN